MLYPLAILKARQQGIVESSTLHSQAVGIIWQLILNYSHSKNEASASNLLEDKAEST